MGILFCVIVFFVTIVLSYGTLCSKQRCNAKRDQQSFSTVDVATENDKYIIEGADITPHEEPVCFDQPIEEPLQITRTPPPEIKRIVSSTKGKSARASKTKRK